MSLDTARLDTALDTARTALLAERVAEGYWEGELSSSALSTAVACAAMQHVQTATGTEEHGALIQGGLHWLCLLYTSPSPRDGLLSRMPSSA